MYVQFNLTVGENWIIKGVDFEPEWRSEFGAKAPRRARDGDCGEEPGHTVGGEEGTAYGRGEFDEVAASGRRQSSQSVSQRRQRIGSASGRFSTAPEVSGRAGTKASVAVQDRQAVTAVGVEDRAASSAARISRRGRSPRTPSSRASDSKRARA